MQVGYGLSHSDADLLLIFCWHVVAVLSDEFLESFGSHNVLKKKVNLPFILEAVSELNDIGMAHLP